MGARINYTEGDVINGLVYIKDVKRVGRDRRALFTCKCGVKFEADLHNVRRGHTNSCGCFSLSELRKRATHGYARHWLFRRWNDIKTRCYNSNSPAYKYYGGRGITMHDLWINDFQAFHKHVSGLVNYKKSLTLDRINNDGTTN